MAFIDRALQTTFRRFAVDAGRLALSSFSDGASYALSLGLTNGALFTHTIALDPVEAPGGETEVESRPSEGKW